MHRRGLVSRTWSSWIYDRWILILFAVVPEGVKYYCEFWGLRISLRCSAARCAISVSTHCLNCCRRGHPQITVLTVSPGCGCAGCGGAAYAARLSAYRDNGFLSDTFKFHEGMGSNHSFEESSALKTHGLALFKVASKCLLLSLVSPSMFRDMRLACYVSLLPGFDCSSHVFELLCSLIATLQRGSRHAIVRENGTAA